ncbi:RcnB family protein [Dyella marensis]|jgi:Ni/Co efflux regulator RcnB|uniref:Regulator RcnB of Ni and Co efflux n=1 Tax=Dyella marensis TaxID=500610 RepID=A0A1I2FF28_9GAMM|nr:MULTISPECIES: RcnB family protein [Dyella]SFF03180.1 regulator RcnB of Ni and Co efflux [Dyella marensis]
MKRLLSLTVSIVLLAMSAASWAAPQDHDWDHDRGNDRGHNPKDEGRHDNGRHRGWEKHAYRRGERLPDRYYTHTYYVTDYERYHLRRPERGYRYVRDDEGQIFLTAVATGLIVDIVVNGH